MDEAHIDSIALPRPDDARAAQIDGVTVLCVGTPPLVRQAVGLREAVNILVGNDELTVLIPRVDDAPNGALYGAVLGPRGWIDLEFHQEPADRLVATVPWPHADLPKRLDLRLQPRHRTRPTRT